MSIYSGFSTRILESKYNREICKLLHLCQYNLLLFITKGKVHTGKIDISSLEIHFKKIFNSLKSLEAQKYLDPKFTDFCKELSTFLTEKSAKIPDPYSQSKLNEDLKIPTLDDLTTFVTLNEIPKTVSNIKFGQSSSNKKLDISNKPRQFRFTREKLSRPISSKIYSQGLKINSTKSNCSFKEVRKKAQNMVSLRYQDQAFGLVIKKINKKNQ